MAKESAAKEPTKITITDLQSHMPGFSGRIITPFQIARRIALGLFAEHKCYKFEATEAGLLGTYADSKQVLLPRAILEEYVLSCLTDLAIQDITVEFAGHVRQHDAVLRESAKQKERYKQEESERDKKRREKEAYKKLADCRATAYDIKQSLKKIQPKIDANEQEISLARQQSPHRPVRGTLQPESNTVAEALARIETLKARGREFKEALDVAEENVRVAEAEVKQFCG